MIISRSPIISLLLLLVSLLGLPSTSKAHCDTMNGPVVRSARLALETGNVEPALMWVRTEVEGQIRSVFQSTLRVRVLSADAKALADRYFYETLVRLHREGEGAPFTGLQDHEGKPETGIALAEQSLSAGSSKGLVRTLASGLSAKVEESHRRVHEASVHADADVEAGRRYVAAYVEYIHLIEQIHRLIQSDNTAQATPDHAH